MPCKADGVLHKGIELRFPEGPWQNSEIVILVERRKLCQKACDTDNRAEIAALPDIPEQISGSIIGKSAVNKHKSIFSGRVFFQKKRCAGKYMGLAGRAAHALDSGLKPDYVRGDTHNGDGNIRRKKGAGARWIRLTGLFLLCAGIALHRMADRCGGAVLCWARRSGLRVGRCGGAVLCRARRFGLRVGRYKKAVCRADVISDSFLLFLRIVLHGSAGCSFLTHSSGRTRGQACGFCLPGAAFVTYIIFRLWTENPRGTDRICYLNINGSTPDPENE